MEGSAERNERRLERGHVIRKKEMSGERGENNECVRLG